MGITSTGSLCAANNQLPAGVTRQYNMVEVDSEYTKARVHVREMRVPEIFGPGRFSELDGWSFTDVAWSQAPKNMLVNTGRGGGFEVVLAEQAEKLMSQVKYKDAALHLMAAKDRLGSYGRKLLLEALFRDQHIHRHQHEAMAHEHSHGHDDDHHDHTHDDLGSSHRHSHWHEHDSLEHAHPHWPDLHHRHKHE